MIIDNGERKPLIISGVFEGLAGVSGPYVSFVPNLAGRKPEMGRAGILADVLVKLTPVKDADGPFWTARFEVMS